MMIVGRRERKSPALRAGGREHWRVIHVQLDVDITAGQLWVDTPAQRKLHDQPFETTATLRRGHWWKASYR